jgi:hypothetical protein
MCARLLGLGAVALALLYGSVSCLPADTRPAPGSILLTVASGDEPVTMTADGWAITVDRLILGIGGLHLAGSDSRCNDYSESSYIRLLDGRLPDDQKVGIVYGLGQCYFGFQVFWPSSDAVLGQGVSEADRERMEGRGGRPGQYRQGMTLDFSATATRAMETKRVHWQFRQPATYPRCFRKPPDAAPPQPIELRGDENVTFHIAIRGAALFGDDFDPTTAKLRFDPIAAADTVHGNADHEVTLDELRTMSMDAVRQYGPYGVPATMTGGPNSMPRSLEDYMYRVLIRPIARFREDVSCDNNFGF